MRVCCAKKASDGLCGKPKPPFFRNIPVLLQLLMWYVILTEVLPPASDAWSIGSIFLSKGGLNYPIPVWAMGQLWAAVGLLVGVVLIWLYRRWAKAQFEATGQLRSLFLSLIHI